MNVHLCLQHFEREAVSSSLFATAETWLSGRMLFLMPNQQSQITEGSGMLICWFVNISYKPQDVDIAQQVVAIYPLPLAGWLYD